MSLIVTSARTSSHLRSASCFFASASHLRTRIASSHIHTPDQFFISYIFISAHSRISDLRILYRRICVASAHFRISDPHISDLFISYITFIFRSSYFETHLVFTVLGLHDVVTLSYLIKIFKISLSYIYNLIYLRLQNLISLNIISPLSGQPSSSLFGCSYPAHTMNLHAAKVAKQCFIEICLRRKKSWSVDKK